MRLRLGLRGRVAGWFAVIGLVLSVLFGVVTFFGVRAVLVTQLEQNALDQTIADVRVVSETLLSEVTSESQVLAALRPPVRSRPFLLRDGEWYSASLQLRNDELPAGLIETVVAGTPARQSFEALGTLLVAVGIPLAPGSAYFEVFSLDSLNHTLGTLRNTLLVSGAGATAAAAVLGWGAARRALRPLRRVELVAEEIAAGSLSARLDESLDPDLARLSAAFNHMADALAARIQREARFASDVSHELRSPLTTLLATLSVLDRRRDELSAEGREALDLLEEDAVRLQRMVVDLLELARLDAGQQAVDLDEMGIAEAARRTVTRLRPELPIVVDPSALGVTVAVDLRRLERILGNYLDNAETHGGGAMRVVVSAEGDRARVGVEDAGPGISDADRHRVFDRYARGIGASHQRASGGGSGLGLSLAAENARVLGGSVRLEPVEGGGTRAVLELPVVVGT